MMGEIVEIVNNENPREKYYRAWVSRAVMSLLWTDGISIRSYCKIPAGDIIPALEKLVVEKKRNLPDWEIDLHAVGHDTRALDRLLTACKEHPSGVITMS